MNVEYPPPIVAILNKLINSESTKITMFEISLEHWRKKILSAYYNKPKAGVTCHFQLEKCPPLTHLNPSPWSHNS